MVCEQSYQSYRVNQVQFTDPLSGSVRSLVDFFIGDSNMKYIPLTKGQFAIVDDDDYDYLMQWKWQAQKGRHTWYAVRGNSFGTKGKRQQSTVYMHRVILHCPKTYQVDHINHNGLDNRKRNIRICSSGDNNRNRIPQTNCTSAYKGVSWAGKKWRCMLWHKKKHLHVGYYASEVEAAKAYDKNARELFGEFVYCNFKEIR